MIYLFLLFLLFLIIAYYVRKSNIVIESQVSSRNLSTNLSNNVWTTNIEAQLDDLLNKLKNVQNVYAPGTVTNMTGNNMLSLTPPTVLFPIKFGLIEKINDNTEDPELYVNGTSPDQNIHLKLPKGLKGQMGCQGPSGPDGPMGQKGDLGVRGQTGLNIIPSLISNRPLTSIE